MSTTMIDLHVVDIVGPLPMDNSGLMMLGGDGKTFPVQCGFVDGQTLAYVVAKVEEPLPYRFLSDVLKAANIKLEWVKIIRANDQLYCQLYFDMPSTGKPIRMTVENASVGVLSAIASSAPIRIEKEVLDRIVDSTSPYNMLKGQFETLWPLPQITDTASLRSLSNFVDSAMPDGSVFASETAKS